MILRPYQKDIIQKATATNGNVLIQAPTGSGKTLIAQKIITHHKNNNKTSLFVAPKINLLSQTIEAFKNLNPQVIHSSNKEKIDKNAHAFVSTIQTISKRIELLEEMGFDYIVFDEMHYGASGKMQEIIKKVHKGKIIGLSATPYDKDGKLLTKGFDTIIDSYDARYMVENNYLVPIKCYEAYTPNLDGIKTKANDWDMIELDFRFNNPQMIGKVISVTKDTIANRHKTIVFCINISHAEAMSKAYSSIGLDAKAIHSKLSKSEQAQILDEFKNGDLKVLTSVDQLTTGFDVPSTDTIVFARATQSQNLYKQMIGRGLRLSPETNKKEAILLDCAGVISRLGMPLEPIKEKIQKEIKREPYICKNCQSTKPRVFSPINYENKNIPVTICPTCKDENEWLPTFMLSCKFCKRHFDFKNEMDKFSFCDNSMSLHCDCEKITTFGSLNDEEIVLRELQFEEMEELLSTKIDPVDLELLALYGLNEKISMARNKNTPKEILIALFLEQNKLINLQLVINKNTPVEILEYLAYEDSYEIRLHISTRKDFFKQSRVSEQIKLYLAKNEEEDIKLNLLKLESKNKMELIKACVESIPSEYDFTKKDKNGWFGFSRMGTSLFLKAVIKESRRSPIIIKFLKEHDNAMVREVMTKLLKNYRQ